MAIPMGGQPHPRPIFDLPSSLMYVNSVFLQVRSHRPVCEAMVSLFLAYLHSWRHVNVFARVTIPDAFLISRCMYFLRPSWRLQDLLLNMASPVGPTILNRKCCGRFRHFYWGALCWRYLCQNWHPDCNDLASTWIVFCSNDLACRRHCRTAEGRRWIVQLSKHDPAQCADHVHFLLCLMGHVWYPCC